jgi:hypothetical protein
VIENCARRKAIGRFYELVGYSIFIVLGILAAKRFPAEAVHAA